MGVSPALSARDRERSYSSRMLPSIEKALNAIPALPPDARLLDIGCGHGGLTLMVGKRLGVAGIHGLDLDVRAVAGARAAGVDAVRWDIRNIPLPHDDASFEVVSMFGVLDYVPTFDVVLREIRRLLQPDGHVVVSLPNLASWHNRVALALGHQPRDLEVSSERLVGVHPRYRSDSPVGHVSAVTSSAFVELMTHHGFHRVALIGAAPRLRRRIPGPALILDAIAARRPQWARRFVYVGRKGGAAAGAGGSAAGWWAETAPTEAGD